MRAVDLPFIGKIVVRRFRAWEGYNFWEHHCPGFRRPYRDLTAKDVTIKMQKSLPNLLQKLTTPQRPRLLLKITGWSRMGFLYQLFPHAQFVHIVRDGRAVANSLLNSHFWDGWEGSQHGRWGTLTPEQEKRWLETGQEFVVLAGIQWERLLQATQIAQTALPTSQFYQLHYEELCAHPHATLQKLADFCQLGQTSAFIQQIPNTPFPNQNGKWQKELTPEQQHQLTNAIRQQLLHYHYESL